MKHTIKSSEAISAEEPSTLWRHADFMKLWSGQTISLFGSALTRLALPLIAVVALDATAAQMGFLGAIEAAPLLVVGLFAGVWVDRFRRRTLLIGSDILRALLLVTIPVAAFLNVISMAQLYIVGFLAGSLTVVFNLASRSYLPSLLDRHRLVEGNAKLKISSSVTAVAGPSLAGFVIQAVTATFAVILDAVSYLLSACCIAVIRKPEEDPQASHIPLIVQVRDGIGIVLGNPLLRAFAACTATSNFTSGILFTLYILFGTRELGLNAAQLGVIYGIGASGALVGAVIASRVVTRYGIGAVVVGGAVLGSLEVIPVALATPRLAMLLLLLSSFIGNFGWTVYNINASSLRQAVTPMNLQGRMNATTMFICEGVLPLGALAGGILGEMFGLRSAIVCSAIGSLFSFFWVLCSPVRTLQDIPESS